GRKKMRMEEKILEIVRKCRSFLITSHIRLDGDAIGSELALYHALRRMGKKAVVYNEDETPEAYGFLPGAEEIVHTPICRNGSRRSSFSTAASWTGSARRRRGSERSAA
ncbi:MAG TPA: hypothetical protein PKW20_07225, partial [Syntrophales bacterium]|nr:hypothetical protein [Syntrophales bacterium]